MAESHSKNPDAQNPTLTEHLRAHEYEYEADGPVAVTYIKVGNTWQEDTLEELDEDPAEYRCECSCGESFDSWGAATDHVEEVRA